ncbi:MAG: CHAT domain-containing protein [Acidimicrobiia bacterium]|nr:CHAT domain-containing protein [Acidimicrobiia bacterium]
MSDTDSDLAIALGLVDRVQAEPQHVLREADGQAASATGEARAVFLWATGLSSRELGDLERSRRDLEAAIALAESVGRGRRAAQMRDSLAFTLFLFGDDQLALDQTDLARPHLDGQPAARLEMQRGLILQRMGRTQDALDAYRVALRGMRAAGDRLGETRLRVNRANIHAYRGEVNAATADLERAYALATELEQTMLVAAAAHNLGFNVGRSGDVPAALRWYETARAKYADAGVTGSLAIVLEVDHAQLLLTVGLSDEARALAQRAIAMFEQSGNAADRAEAVLLAAQAALASDDPATARELAADAHTAFAEQNRASWQAMATYINLEGQLAELLKKEALAPGEARSLAAAAREAREALEQHGWRIEALHARTAEARGCLADGDIDRARELLETTVAARSRGPVQERLRAWHATAMLRTIEGNPAGAKRALMAGLRLLDERRSTLGASELRVSSAVHGNDLVDLGLSLALNEDDPGRLLVWADRVRAGAIRLQPVRPPADEALASDLTELRLVEQEATDAALAGRPTDLLAARTAALETRVRDRARRHGSERQATQAIQLGELQAALDDRTLVEYVDHRGKLYALVATAAAVRRVDLGPSADVSVLIDRARFDLSRLAHGHRSELSLVAAETSLADVGASLQAQLLDPLALPEGDLVIVPAGQLHGLTWRVIPALRTRSFVVVPSAFQWIQAAGRPSPATDDQVLLVGGPDLPHAPAEVAAIARIHAAKTRLTGRNAVVDRVLDAMQHAAHAHIVAHGEFRPDNPMFSSLRMADGPLTVYDMERLHTVPALITLPACDAATTGSRPGDELLGLSAALLALGVRTLVAPQVPIPDAETPPLMRSFHRRLRDSADAGQALAEAISAAATDSPQQRAVAMSFVVMGA